MAEIQARHKTVGTIQRSILTESFVTFPTATRITFGYRCRDDIQINDAFHAMRHFLVANACIFQRLDNVERGRCQHNCIANIRQICVIFCRCVMAAFSKIMITFVFETVFTSGVECICLKRTSGPALILDDWTIDKLYEYEKSIVLFHVDDDDGPGVHRMQQG